MEAYCWVYLQLPWLAQPVLLLSIPASGRGMLAVSLDETTTLSDDQGVLRIQADGQVFLNQTNDNQAIEV
ncbi:hypothetical protein JOY44_25090 (plasmid) [Phormidium sp. CLA17]|uniref:hypothetical protein n=1 Tax=Leptolyngbya sp. Cla-17 TaxID=2803751 RepID=UPI0019321E4A|nr:hypothetical protein [Leptolyngbya sp. Cla-17]MBM0744804.1 hypothetical protein [Leptolyngbya sp. Cla-17]